MGLEAYVVHLDHAGALNESCLMASGIHSFLLTASLPGETELALSQLRTGFVSQPGEAVAAILDTLVTEGWIVEIPRVDF